MTVLTVTVLIGLATHGSSASCALMTTIALEVLQAVLILHTYLVSKRTDVTHSAVDHPGPRASPGRAPSPRRSKPRVVCGVNQRNAVQHVHCAHVRLINVEFQPREDVFADEWHRFVQGTRTFRLVRISMHSQVYDPVGLATSSGVWAPPACQLSVRWPPSTIVVL